MEITPRTLDHSVSFEIPTEVIQIRDHVDVDADDEFVDSGAAGGHSLDLAMVVGSPQVEVFGSFHFEASGRIISCRFVGDDRE